MYLLTHSCSISRNTTVGTNGRRQLQLSADGVACLAIPMSAQAAIQNNFDIGRAYDFYFDTSADVKIKDKIIWQGMTFTVSGKQVFSMPVVGHMHVMAQQEIGS